VLGRTDEGDGIGWGLGDTCRYWFIDLFGESWEWTDVMKVRDFVSQEPKS
jgi:hypothetical protein